MCLAIPSKLVSIINPEEQTFRKGNVSFDGIIREVNLSMVPTASVNDYVLVHVGVAISIVDEKEAQKTLEYIRQIENIEEELGGERIKD